MNCKFRSIFMGVVMLCSGCASNDIKDSSATRETKSSPEVQFRTYMKQGISSAKQKNFDEALIHFRKAEIVQPNNPDVIKFIAQSLYHENNYNESIKYYNRYIEINPYEYKSYGRLGIIYAKKHEYKTSINYLKKVLELKSDDLPAMANLARVYFKEKEYVNCEKYMELYESTFKSKDWNLFPSKKKEIIYKTLERFSNYRTVIQKEHSNQANKSSKSTRDFPQINGH